MKQPTTKHIRIDWRDEKSIKKAELKKFVLKNKGYRLTDTATTTTYSTLTYKKV